MESNRAPIPSEEPTPAFDCSAVWIYSGALDALEAGRISLEDFGVYGILTAAASGKPPRRIVSISWAEMLRRTRLSGQAVYLALRRLGSARLVDPLPEEPDAPGTPQLLLVEPDPSSKD